MYVDFSSGAFGVLDVTCFVSKPRISITGDNTLFIGGYKSGDDTDAIVPFGRQSDTGTGSGLPTDSRQEDSRTGGGNRLLRLPASGGIERIGAFYCEAQKDDIAERIPAIIMANNSKSSLVIIQLLCLWNYETCTQIMGQISKYCTFFF